MGINDPSPGKDWRIFDNQFFISLPKLLQIKAMLSGRTTRLGNWIAASSFAGISVSVGGVLVNISRWLLALVLLGLSSSVASADPVDPKMGLEGGCCSTGLFSPNDPNFAFTVFARNFTTVGQSELFDFINATGHTALEVDLLATLIPGTPDLTYTCAQSSEYFNNCMVIPEGGGQTLIRFFNPNHGAGGFGGIPFATDLPSPNSCDGIHSCTTTTPGADFAVRVTDVNGDLVNLNQTPDGFKVRGFLIVPEPSTVLLVLAGGIFLFLCKRS